MFTGIIEEVGKVESVTKGADSAIISIQATKVIGGTRPGDSIAVNGVCLTVTAIAKRGFAADVMHETLNRSTLGKLRPGQPVNLERAMAADGRFGGHIVAGHVDGVGTVTGIRADGNATWFTISASPSVLRLIIEKGSIAVDGISLTVARLTAKDFSVSIIPHTTASTILPTLRIGDAVNLENDCIGKYVERLLSNTSPPTKITAGFLAEHGF